MTDIFERYRSDDPEVSRMAQNQIIVDNIALVRRITQGASRRTPYDAVDLEADGIFGLLAAARSFNSDRGVTFEAYAHQRISGAIRDFLRKDDQIVSRRDRASINLRKAEADRLERTLQRNPTEAEITAASGVDVIPESQQVDGVEEYSIQADHGDLEMSEMTGHLARAISTLTERERVLFGMRHVSGMQINHMADFIGVADSHISQMLTKAAGKVRSGLVSAEIERPPSRSVRINSR